MVPTGMAGARRLLQHAPLDGCPRGGHRERTPVLGLYVRPAARGRGVGSALMHAAMAAASARPGLRVPRPTPAEANVPAQRLNESTGLRAWDVGPMATTADARFRAQVRMDLKLGANGPDRRERTRNRRCRIRPAPMTGIGPTPRAAGSARPPTAPTPRDAPPVGGRR